MLKLIRYLFIKFLDNRKCLHIQISQTVGSVPPVPLFVPFGLLPKGRNNAHTLLSIAFWIKNMCFEFQNHIEMWEASPLYCEIPASPFLCRCKELKIQLFIYQIEKPRDYHSKCDVTISPVPTWGCLPTTSILRMRHGSRHIWPLFPLMNSMAV